jgi:hypothetical protein
MNYENEIDTLVSILATIKDWDIDAVNSLIWRLAEARNIVILQTVTAEHIGVDEPLDAVALHKELQYHPILMGEGIAAVREAKERIEHEDYDEEAEEESYPRDCVECSEEFTPSTHHELDKVCDECVSNKGKLQQLMPPTAPMDRHEALHGGGGCG